MKSSETDEKYSLQITAFCTAFIEKALNFLGFSDDDIGGDQVEAN